MIEIDPQTYRLRPGSHTGPEQGMCVMELAAYLAHEPHSDHPQCVCPTIAAFLRRWNDDLPDDERQMLLPYAGRCLGSNHGPAVAQRRAWMALDWLVRECAPAWLELAGLPEEALALRGLAELSPATVEGALPCLRRVSERSNAVGDAAWDAAWDAACAAAWDAAWDAACAAAGDAVVDAVRAAVREKLQPTVQRLQTSALQLLDRMLAVQP